MKERVRRRITKLLILIFLISNLAMTFDSPVFATPIAEPEITNDDPNVVEELLEKRTEISKHYLMSDGSIKADIYLGNVHYQDEYGQYQEIDTMLHAVDIAEPTESGNVLKKVKNLLISAEEESQYFEPLSVEYDAMLPKNFTNGYSMGKGEDKLTFMPIGANPSKGIINADESSVDYAEAWAYTDVNLKATMSGVKETIILKNSQAPTYFTFEVIGGLQEELTLGDLSLEPAWLEDANGERRDVIQTVRREVNKVYLDLAADVDGLVYPVMIDPTVTIDPSAAMGAYVRNSNPSTAYGNGSTITIGTNSSGDIFRGFIRFDVSSIPSGSKISNAVLSMYLYTEGNSTNRDIGLYKVTQNWDAAIITWNNISPYFGNFTELVGTLPANTLNSYNESNLLTSVVEGWVAGTIPNYGLYMLNLSEGSTGTNKSFYAPNYSNSNKPKLTITYSQPPTAPAITVPNGGETWDAQHTVTWNAASDTVENTVTLQTASGGTVQVAPSSGSVAGQSFKVISADLISRIGFYMYGPVPSEKVTISLKDYNPTTRMSGSTVYASGYLGQTAGSGFAYFDLPTPLSFPVGTMLTAEVTGWSASHNPAANEPGPYNDGTAYFGNPKALKSSYDLGVEIIHSNGYQSQLKYQIQLSTNNGTNYHEIVNPTPAGATSYTYDFSSVPDTSQAKIRMRAFDGTHYGPWDVSKTFTIQHDSTPPNLVLSPNTTNWINGNITITANATDDKSGVKRIQKPDGNWVAGSTTTYVVGENGTYTFKAEDNAGNVGTQVITVNNIDRTSPSSPTIDGNINWSNKDVLVTISSGTDSLSDVAATEYMLSGATSLGWTPYTSAITIQDEGKTTVSARTIDNAGNVSSMSTKVINIDKTMPTLTLNQDTSDWTNRDITITAYATDDVSGVKRIQLPTDEWVTGGNASYIAAENGTYEFRVEDQAGNITTQNININNIDKTTPVLTLIQDITIWTNGVVTISASALDTGSGVKQIQLPSGELVTDSSSDYIVTENDTYQFSAEDLAGNIITDTITITNIDKSAPTINAPAITLISSNSITVVPAAEDEMSELHETPYLYNRNDEDIGDWTAETLVEDELIPNTQYTYKYKARDAAGNISEYSPEASRYTLALNPIGISIISSDSNTISVRITNNAQNGEIPETLIELRLKSDGTLISSTGWSSDIDRILGGLSLDAEYELWSKTRNGDGVENDFIKAHDGLFSNRLHHGIISVPIEDGLINENPEEAIYTLLGKAWDPDQDHLTIFVKIGDLEKSVELDNAPSTEPFEDNWSILFSGDDLPNGTYDDITIKIKDSKGEEITLPFEYSLVVAVSRIARIEVEPAEINVPVGQSQELKAIAYYWNGITETSKDVTEQASWSNLDPEVATDSNGEITGVKKGQVTIQAQYNEFTGSALVTVTDPVIIKIDILPERSVAVGNAFTLTATAFYSDGSQKDITQLASWSSDDPSLATVNKGTVIGISVGNATIQAELEGIKGTILVQVTAQKAPSPSPGSGSARPSPEAPAMPGLTKPEQPPLPAEKPQPPKNEDINIKPGVEPTPTKPKPDTVTKSYEKNPVIPQKVISQNQAQASQQTTESPTTVAEPAGSLINLPIRTPEIGLVKGYVKDAQGNPITDARIELHSTPRVTYTDSTGYFQFNNVEMGAHKIYLADESITKDPVLLNSITVRNGNDIKSMTGDEVVDGLRGKGIMETAHIQLSANDSVKEVEIIVDLDFKGKRKEFSLAGLPNLVRLFLESIPTTTLVVSGIGLSGSILVAFLLFSVNRNTRIFVGSRCICRRRAKLTQGILTLDLWREFLKSNGDNLRVVFSKSQSRKLSGKTIIFTEGGEIIAQFTAPEFDGSLLEIEVETLGE